MAELSTQITKAKGEELKYKSEIRKLEGEIDVLQQKVDYAKGTLDDNLEAAKEEYDAAQRDLIQEKFDHQITQLEEEIEEIQSLMDSKDVEDTEELVKARDTREYLNGAAVVINNYHMELKKISTPYFIDLAYNENSMKIKTFRKVFKTIPRRIQELQDLRLTVTQPFQAIQDKTKEKGANQSIYFSSTVMSWWVTLMTPTALTKSVKRAHFLHDSAALYHELMHTLVSLGKRTDEDIAKIFSALLQLKGQKLKDQLQAKQLELEEVNDSLQAELDAIEFDGEAFRREANTKIYGENQALQALETRLETIQERLDQVQATLEGLKDERTEMLERERDSFLKSRDSREVVLPPKLLYDWNLNSNSYFSIDHGLYLYEDRETVASFIQLFMFQMRNVMEWGAIQFRILDLLGGEFAAPLMLPESGKSKAQDITISTLKEEREKVVELMHDLLVRRKTQILASAPNLGDYNLVQKASSSAPVPYQIIFIVLTDTLKMDEKLIQLIHIGEKLGLLVYIFMKDELLTIQLIKSVESYFSSIVELTDSGLSTYEPTSYRAILEEEEADRKSGM